MAGQWIEKVIGQEVWVGQHGVGFGPGLRKEPWTEPKPPPGETAVLRLDLPESRVERITLRANQPSTVRLQGPADLVFQGFIITLTARELERNLADPRWGSSRATTGTTPAMQEILLAAPARIEAVGVRTNAQIAGVRVEYKEGSYQEWVKSLQLIRDVSVRSGLHEQAVITQAVRFGLSDEDAKILLRSPSLPSRVALALGDDTPVQLFAAEMKEGGSVTSRDLTGQINAAWQRARNGGSAEVQLRITSLTDGVVTVDLEGRWGRLYVGAEREISLLPLQSESIQVAWPFDQIPQAQAALRLTGRITGGRRMGLVSGAPTFWVRATERLEVAQAVRLVGGDPPGVSRQILAVWLLLPHLPRSEERLEIRLTRAVGAPAIPSDEVLTRFEVTLPADAGIYQGAAGGYWFRAALEKVLALDGTQAAEPLFVAAAGRGAGTLLAHRGLQSAAADGERIPAGQGSGVALVRNMDRTGTWEPQGFNRKAAQWLVDLELAPAEAEHGKLITFAFGDEEPTGVRADGSGRIAVEIGPESVRRPADTPGPTPPELRVTIASAVRSELTAQLLLSRQIR